MPKLTLSNKLLIINLPFLVSLFLFMFGTTFLYGQVNVSVGNTMTEDFNGIGTNANATLPSGWKMSKSTSARTVNSYSSAVTATEQRAGDNMSSSAPNGLYNFAAGDPTSAPDRALGGLSSSSASRSVNIYVDLYNNGSDDIDEFVISYEVEKYRNGTNASGFSIQMYYSTDGSNWTSAGGDFLTSFTADGNNNGFASAPGSTVSVSAKTLNVSLSSGSHLYLAWNYSVTSGSTTSNAQALGIDDVSITANGGCAPLDVEITGDAQICQGESTTLTASGGETYVWSTGATSDNITVNPAVTTTYIVTATDGSGCTGTAFIEVTVNDLPATPVITITDNVCPSTDGTITATGCGTGTTLEWATSASGPWSTTTPTYTTSPITVYARCVDNVTGCVSSVASATTNPVLCCPSVVVNITGDAQICQGESTTLTASGGETYVWSTGATSDNITVNPAVTTTYIVTATDGSGCTGTAFIEVTVNDLPATPVITITDNVCPSTDGTITATGCGTGTTLEWATSASGPWSTTTPTYTTSPITVYARCVDDVTGCVSSVASATTNPTNCSSPGDCENMFISEYIEGTSNNKAVEIYNPTSSPINLSGGYIHIYHNGSSTPTASIALSGTIMPFGTFVVASTLADPTLQGMADMLAVTLLFDGDDAIALEYNNSILDVLGQIGFDPGSQWGGPGLRTKDQTLRRKSTVQQGDSDGSDAFDPADEWDPYPVNTFNGLGLHLSRCECDVMVVNITGDAQICQGDSTTLTASGGSTYLWSTGDTVAIINVIPTTTSTYVVTATSVNGCTGTAFIEVTVNDLPAAPVITITDNVCPSTDGTIAAAGCGPGTILEWSHYPTGPWSTTTPNYALFSIPVYARCVDTLTGCISPIANETTNVESCTIIGDCESMFISEYVEGTSNNKAIEIYNPTSSTINLSGGYIKLYTNGSWTPTKIITLSGSIPPFESFVVASTLANPSLQALADMLDAGLLYDGDDAIVLEYNNTILDVFGQIGFDPGSQWGGPGLRTKDQTLRRKSTVQKGDTNGLDAFDPAIEWDPQPVNTFDGLGEHISECDCPGLTVAPENVTITNSSCTDCVVDGGVIIAPVAPCPGGSDLEYSTDGGVTWTTDLPVYNQEGPAQTIITRCVCEKDPTMVSPSSAAVTTVPGECPLSCFYTFEITDPCSCNNDATVAGNDGTFDEVITVTGPTGHIITASVTGGTPTSITFTESTPGVYVSIPFQHIDNIGYTALIYADGILIGPISNKCAYPDVAIDITGPIENCLNSDDIPLTATISGDDGSGTYVWSGTGVTGNVFNPSGLPVGSITISLSYTGVNNGNISPDGGITPAYPGCIQPAEKSVDIIEGAPAPDIDDIEVCEGESTLIIAGVSGSIDTTNTFTWDFEAGITGPGVSEDLTIADNGPTQSVGSGVNGVIAQGAGAGCTAAISGTGFDDVDFATAVAEDKYFEFCVGTPQSGIIFDGVSAVNWIHRKSNSGPVNWALVSDSDINTPLLTGMLGNNNCTSAGGAITLNTDGCYRLYYWGASGASGTLRVSEMVITANYQVPTGVFNFYNVDPVSNPGATPVAMGTSYDPGTTPSSSPDTIWVTVVEGGCESLPTEVVVTVHANPTLDVMQPDAKCEGDSFDIADVVLTPSPTGGTFSYYASLSDAETETNPITSGLDNITSNLTVFVRYELPTGCYVIEQINFVFNALPPAPDVPSELNVCTGESTLITVNDGPINVVTNWGFESGLTENGISEDPSVTSDGPVHTLGSGVGSPVHQSAGSGCSNAISMSGFDPANTTLAQAIAANQYIEFCLGTTQPGYTFDGVTSIDWEHRASNSGPLSWALLASTDLGTTILSGTISGGGSCKVGGGAISINTNTCYRIYYWNASSALGNVRIDNFAITAQYSSGATYNWYNVDPATNPGATPVATGNSYDPGTTAFTSPDEIWVTAILNGCEGPASKITVNVGITPTINDVADQEHCAGALTDAIDFTGTPADSMIVFNWTNDNTSIGLAASGTGDIPSFVTINNGSTTQVATITVTPSLTVNGVTCSNDSITFTITVHPTPTVSISIEDTSGNLDNDGEICEGDSATLTASGATSYVWNTGATTPSITVTAGGVYTVTGQNAQGCSATASVTIMVHPVPTPSITVTENSLIPNDGTVIEGAPATLTATGGGSYLWNTGATTPSITVVNNVSGTYTYTVTVTNEFGCTAIASQDIIVIPPPCNLVCSGNQQITLAPGNCEYQLPNLVTLAGICEIYEIVQISGPTAGSFIAPGTYELKWELRRRSNGEVMDECTTTVTVVGYPNPSRTLACNNHIYISADDHCEVTLYADMFLEGGPYGCYWNYQLIVDGQAIPQGEGLALGLGKHTYEVVDPVTGNRCWGTFTVEDKLPPVVECNCSSEPADVSGFTEIGRFGGKIYYLSNNNYTWTGAYAHATSVNGTMLSIGSADENTFIVNAMRNAGYTTDFRIWIGLTDDENYGGTEAGSNQVNGWVWASGEPVNYTNWNNGEPNNSGNEDYVEMFGNLTNPGVWNDSNNNRSQRYIMEVEDCSFKCYEFDVVSEETVSKLFDPNYKYKLTTPPTATDACGPVNGTFTDEIINHGACGSKRILRHWTFTDAAGWTATCTQIFTFNPISVEDLTPPAALVTLSCGEDTSPAAVAAFKDVDSRTGGPSANNVGAFYDDYGQTPSIIELQEGHPYGYFTYPHIGWDGEDHLQKVDPSVCNIYVSYTDVNIPACNIGCGGNMKVIRKWTLLDWCTGEVFEYTQVIKAVDDKAPTFDVKDVTISVNPWGCIADWNVENPWELQDNCSKESEIKWGVRAPFGSTLSGSQATGYVISGLKKGIYSITYWAEDCCGNYTEKVARLTVIDRSAPVAVAKQNIVLSLTSGSRPGDGTAKLYAWQVDNGSYDHCTGVKLEIRRIGSSVPSCGNVGNNGTNNNATFNHSPADNLPGVWAHPEDTKGSTVLDTDNGEFVMFCCEDIPANEIGAVHQVELRVWDDGNMNGIIGDNQDINGMRDNYNTTWADIRVENKYPPQIVCPPDVTVTCDMELNLSEGVDTPVDSVDLTMTGVPTIYDICGNQNATYRDVVRRGNCDNVTRVERTFKVTKGIGANAVTVQCRQIITVEWIEVPFVVTFGSNNGKEPWDKCEFSIEDARGGSILIKKPTVVHGPCDIVGENIKIDTFLFEDGACKKWRVEYNYINWCTGEQRGPFVYYYYYKDNNAPSIVCPADQEFAATVDPANPNDGCLADVVLKASASDSLKCAAESWVKWQVFFDGWANGTVDRLASSFVDKTKYGRPAGQGTWFPVPRLVNGQLNPEWVRLQNAHPGVVLEDLVYVTYVIPSKASGEEITLPSFKLPNEQIWHKILWKVTDGCGNVAQCQSRVKAIDKKPPTPYCIHLSTALMAGNPKMVELWAKDFDKGAFDNCTPQSKLYFTFDGVAPIYTKITEEHYYKAGPNGDPVEATASEYANGRAYKWLPSVRSAGKIWTTAGEFDVKVSVWDEAWNTDFCDVDLRVIDNNQPGTLIAGNVSTEDNRGVMNAEVIANAPLPEYPKSEMTNRLGNYSMDIFVDSELSVSKDDDYLNGVSTLDLVLIQRHILGLNKLNSPYKIIAADATNDEKISAADLSEIRKLILGVTDKYSNNSSWRFVSKGSYMDPENPFPFTEIVVATPDSSDVYDFVAVKIGDVNGNVITNINEDVVETRSNDRVILAVNEAEVEAGEAIAIPVTAEQYNNVAGFQYTMQLNGAEYVGIESGAIEMNASNVGNLGNGVVTMSYASTEPVSVSEGEVLFTIRAKATKAMKVSGMMTLNSAVTAAESYNGNLEVGGVSLAVRTAPVASIELYQNEPNPFKGETTVSFMMPEAGVAKLSVYDMTGRQIVVRTIEAVKGLNSEVFTKAQLGVSGVLYYTLESGDYTATKKMIIVE